MTITILLLIAVIAVALAFEFINGFHDCANAIATVVSTKVLSPKQAVLFGASLEFVGALTGIIAYGAGEVLGAVGKGIGNALGYLKFNNKFVNSVSGFSTAVEIFSKGINIVGGVSVGIYLDEVVNRALNKKDNLVERIKNNIHSTIFSEFLTFIRYIW